MEPTTICVIDGGEVPRKITKVVPYRDGGFALMAPYHSEKRGVLIKMDVDYSQHLQFVNRAEMVEYTADDRVRRSYHADGFAQFSGEREGRIVSGRDEQGQPKGIGVLTNAMDNPIRTGPNCGIQFWGLEDFRPLGPGNRRTLVIGQGDFIYRLCDESSARAYNIEFFIFSFAHFGQHCRTDENGIFLPLWHAGYEGGGRMFEYRVVPLSLGGPYFLGALPFRVPSDFGSASGFVLGGPGEATASQIKAVIQAVYPPPPHIEPGQSLDYTPGASGGPRMPTD